MNSIRPRSPHFQWLQDWLKISILVGFFCQKGVSYGNVIFPPNLDAIQNASFLGIASGQATSLSAKLHPPFFRAPIPDNRLFRHPIHRFAHGGLVQVEG